MAVAFGREALLEALDELGSAAVEAGRRLAVAVYGGSALMLASNFRFASEDVDVRILDADWPSWLSEAVAAVAVARGWSRDWFNDAVAFHLSPLASTAADHVAFGSFPRADGPIGLEVYVPTAPYMLALKLKAIRIADPIRGGQEAQDIRSLMRVVGIEGADEAVALLARYFPVSGAAAEKQRFLLKHLPEPSDAHAPAYPRQGL